MFSRITMVLNCLFLSLIKGGKRTLSENNPSSSASPVPDLFSSVFSCTKTCELLSFPGPSKLRQLAGRMRTKSRSGNFYLFSSGREGATCSQSEPCSSCLSPERVSLMRRRGLFDLHLVKQDHSPRPNTAS